jgi:Cu(I)/Ag(I) efflux system membrane fusion protein
MVLKKGINPFTKQVDTEGVKTTPTIESNPVPVARSEKPTPSKPGNIDNPPTVPTAFKKQLTAVYDASLKLTEAFINTDTKKTQAAADGVAKSLSGVGMRQLSGATHTAWMTQLNAMNAALKSIRQGEDMEKQRMAYARFEDALYQSIKAFAITDKPVYHQFCPMARNGKGAYWLSDKKPIRNPYFGEQMLTCGETKEVIQ